MHGSLPKACPPHTHIAPRLDAVQVANFDVKISYRVSSPMAERLTIDRKVWGSRPGSGIGLKFGVAALSFVLCHILFAAVLCARLQLLCFAFLFFDVCSFRFYVFRVRHNISANRAGVIHFCRRFYLRFILYFCGWSNNA